MDLAGIKNTAVEYIKKYRYVVIVILAGVFLMLLPGGEVPEQIQTVDQTPAAKEEDLQTSLSKILSKIDGAGKVEVLLTAAVGESVIYQTDDDRTEGDTTRGLRTETVILSDSGRAETGLVKQINPPVYLGAVVLCQGADNPEIRLSLVEAVMRATGLTSDRISVLKMK